ncbi:DUF5522 domain-containing protein [Egicoccus halophilus]|uniref:Uncharacterized protein n=1 Tax=Egicoccus halophilus TaxID=1670830 RepID=A0A8J3AH62_9ACTN|nr:DUF5522 domain-containing protein [Egicoccus halophilus]GGI08378.1 hypothetical protein GCM10011354_28790 [Egicoccus halophilus]
MTSPPGVRRLPLVERLDPGRDDYAAILAAHDAAVHVGDPGYLDPSTGFFVFTAAELWDRGDCCGSGCRHCPYDDGPRGAAHEHAPPLPD